MNSILHKQELGVGIYTIPDISAILNYPQQKVRRYLSKYWDDRLGKKLFSETYSWKREKIRAVNFYVLIELFTCFSLQDKGVSPKIILKARENIAKELKTPYPFASNKLLLAGNKILYVFEDMIVDADGTRQTNIIEIIKAFVTNIDFEGDLASRFWPAGKQSSVVVDPHHQFGQPVIAGTNINAEVIFSMYQSGEPLDAIGILYDLTEKQISDALAYHKRKAA